MAGATDSLDESLLEQASAWRREGRGVAVVVNREDESDARDVLTSNATPSE